MKRLSVFVIVILVLSLVIVLIMGGCAPSETSLLKVVTSTSLLATIAERVGGDMVDARGNR